MVKMKLKTACIALLMALAPMTAHASAYDGECRAELANALTEIDLGSLTVKKQSIVPIYGASISGSRVEAIENWVSFNECKGNLVIKASRACFVETTYTTGSCKIDGISNY